MDISEKVDYWLDIADYDMETARSLQKSGRYLYTVFICQQAVEKLLKANYMKRFSKEAPFSHNLVYLNSLVELGTSDSHLKLIAELTTFYIEGRYPVYKKKLSAMIDKEKSSSILKRTEELFKWLKSKLR
ncbi:MAG: HEPN domain-containing protein [Deltaproteobacteria bacterium]|jgi:HEPN domain-containing protein|nr:HEPN domain-containing protein [Deltaproteobacteria bacterium]